MGIFARYLYAVVEAVWAGELAKDAISTDRTSIDWEDKNLQGLFQWGSIFRQVVDTGSAVAQKINIGGDFKNASSV